MEGSDGDRRREVRHPTPVIDRGFQLCEEMASTIVDAAQVLVAALERQHPMERASLTIRELEHKGDAIARDLFELLMPARRGEDRDALKTLMGYLDDVLDAIEAAAARLAIHRVRQPIRAARRLGEIVLRSGHELRLAVSQTRHLRDVFPHTRALHRLENDGDDALRDGIEALFTGRTSVKEILKWKDICEMLEAGTDRCEDIANLLETLVVQAGAEDKLIASRVAMDVERYEVAVDGETLALSGKEFGLLHLLLRHQGKVVRRERLMAEVWGGDYLGDTRTLDTHVGWLRKKIEPRGGVRIVAVRGLGYRLDLARAPAYRGPVKP